MLIKNNTAKNGTKVLFFGQHRLMPDEEKNIPDEVLYEMELNEFGRPTGKKRLLPSIKSQIRLGIITVAETPAPVKKAPKPAAEEPAVSTEPVVEEAVPEQPAEESPAGTPEEDAEAKKAAIAAKRAATRAANRAKKDAAE